MISQQTFQLRHSDGEQFAVEVFTIYQWRIFNILRCRSIQKRRHFPRYRIHISNIREICSSVEYSSPTLDRFFRCRIFLSDGEHSAVEVINTDAEYSTFSCVEVLKIGDISTAAVEVWGGVAHKRKYRTPAPPSV